MKPAETAAPVCSASVKGIAAKRWAVARLYETDYARVARYIAARIGNVHDAEELASEVFLRALRSVDSYEETGAPMEAWIFKIAHNLVANHLRDRSRRRPSLPLDEALSIDSGDNPHETVEHEEEIRELREAMEQLTEAQRQVISLRLAGQMTSEQVAEIMGKKAGAVREMQSAAIRRLRQILRAS